MPEGSETSRVLIVGATGGIGRALVERLRARGADLVLAARRDDDLRSLADQVGGHAIPTDATSFDEVDALVKQSGDLDAIVNLCGSILLRPAHLTSQSEFEETIRINLTTAFAIVRAGAAAMRKRGGSIVLMSSAAGRTGLASHDAISAAKAGVEGLVRSAAASYAPQGIRVNAVAPGLVDTPLSRGITSNEASLKASTSMHPLGRIGSADEVASMIAHLIGPDGTWMTGQILGVDGGLSTVRPR